MAAKGAKRNGGLSNPRSEDLSSPGTRSPAYGRRFPARMRRERAAKTRRHVDKLSPQMLSRGCPEVPCIFGSDRDMTRRDRFASECPHHQLHHGSVLCCCSTQLLGILLHLPTAQGTASGFSNRCDRNGREPAPADGLLGSDSPRIAVRPRRPGQDIPAWRSRLSGVGHGSRARDCGVRTGASPIPRAP